MPIKEYNKLIEELEDLDDVKEFDKVKREDDGRRITMDDYIKNRKSKSNNV